MSSHGPAGLAILESTFMSAAISPPATFVVNGNLVIQFLAGALFLVAGALVAVIVYVFRGLAKEVERLTDRIEVLPDSLGKRIDKLADRMGKLTERIDRLADTLHAEIASVRQDVHLRLE